MKALILFAAGAVLFVSVPQQTGATDFPWVGRGIQLEASLNCPYISHRGGTVFLQLSISTPEIGTSKRRPMNLAVVLDRSGSMDDEAKIEYARKTLFSLIDQLTSEDIFSLVIYDDVIEVLKKAGRVGNKKELRRLVQRVQPRGSTNLGGGMVEGFRQAQKFASKEYVNRVILLSDGLANTGITDDRELNRIARRYRSQSISLTTMGVGLDYNENLMMGLAEHGGGNYYFIESPNGLASIMSKEFNLMAKVVAHNAFIEFTPGKGVEVRDVIGCEFGKERWTFTIPVGDLYSNDRREFTVELLVPPGFEPLVVASGMLRFGTEYGWLRTSPSFSTTIRYTRDVVVIEKNRDMETQAKADIAVSTRKVERAMEALDAGNNEEAAREIGEARQIILSSPAAASGAGAAILGEQAGKLRMYQNSLKDSLHDTRRAKKAIQFDNYKTQKHQQ
ncbi:MAG: VWA domain-containing protein [Ignavibacteriales bacterium]|nr:VWA domain-containing protein [Ignavibacteriales bacterium]